MAREPLTPERYREIHEAHARARRMEGGERATFLQGLGEQDRGLRDEVESLLVHEGCPHDPFAEAIGRTAADILQDEAVVAASLPKRVGGYWVLGLLGEGAMGRVFEALQPGTGRRVALKVMRAGFLPAGHIRRFLQEARILGQLQHPGIAQIFEAGVAEIAGPAGGETPYFAMELVRGETLTHYAGVQGLSIAERVELLVKVCGAVEEAHRKGIVHRDIKPGNILVDGAGQPKVLDFGVAQSTEEGDGAHPHTDAGLIMGTLPYMSPEQVGGERRRLDARSDIYSLGVLAYELLSGRLPLPVQNLTLPEAARVIQEEDPPRLGALHRFLRGDLETIVAKALEKDPARRYFSAWEMGEDFRRVLRHQPIQARPASAVYRMRKFARRHKTLVAVSTLVLLILLVAAGLLERAGVLAVQEKSRAEGMAQEAAERERIAVHQAYRAGMTAAAAAHELGNMGVARQRLDEIPADRRGWEWWHVGSDLDESLAHVAPPHQSTIALGWSADGKRLLVRQKDPGGGEFTVALDRDGEVLGESPLDPRGSPWLAGDALCSGTARAVPGPGEQGIEIRAAWDVSPGGDRIACGVSDRPVVLIRDARTGRVLRELTTGIEPVASLAWSSDGTRLAGGSVERIVRAWNADSGTPLLVSQPLASPIRSVEWSPDGSVIATGGADGTIRMVGARSGNVLTPHHGHSCPVDHLAWSPDGSRLASATFEDASVRIWDATVLHEPRWLAGHSGSVEAVASSPDGEMLASAGRDGTVRFWDPRALEPIAVRRLGAHSSILVSLAWSPDGKRIAVGGKDGTVVVLDARTGRETFRESPRMGEARALSFVGGERLAAGFSNGAVILWDLGERRRLHVRNLEEPDTGEPASGVHALAPSPDGRRLAVGCENGRLEVLDSGTLEPRARRRLLAPGVCPRACVLSVAWSPDGRRLAAGLGDGSVRLLDAATCLEKRGVQAASSYVQAIGWSPDGRRIAAGTFKGNLLLLHGATLEEMVRLSKHPQRIASLAWLPDGATIATASEDRTVGVWSTRPFQDSAGEREARARRLPEATSLVLRLLSELRDPDRVAERLAGDQGLGGPERKVALQELLRISVERESPELRVAGTGR